MATNVNKDYEDYYKLLHAKKALTAASFTTEQVKEVYRYLYNNPHNDEYVAAEFLALVRPYERRTNCDLVGMKVCRVNNVLCLDQLYVEQVTGKRFGTTMVLMKEDDLGILATGYPLEVHNMMLDFFHAIPRQIKILNVLRQ